MRERWQTVSALWEDNKALVNRLNLLGQLDYLHKLSSQLDWQENSDDVQVRVVYSKSGEPTAAVLHDNAALVENVLFWVPCRNTKEANYLPGNHQQRRTKRSCDSADDQGLVRGKGYAQAPVEAAYPGVRPSGRFAHRHCQGRDNGGNRCGEEVGGAQGAAGWTD